MHILFHTYIHILFQAWFSNLKKSGHFLFCIMLIRIKWATLLRLSRLITIRGECEMSHNDTPKIPRKIMWKEKHKAKRKDALH